MAHRSPKGLLDWALPKTRSRARSALKNPDASRCAPALNLKIPPIKVSVIVMDCKWSFLKIVYKVLFGPRWFPAPRCSQHGWLLFICLSGEDPLRIPKLVASRQRLIYFMVLCTKLWTLGSLVKNLGVTWVSYHLQRWCQDPCSASEFGACRYADGAWDRFW